MINLRSTASYPGRNDRALAMYPHTINSSQPVCTLCLILHSSIVPTHNAIQSDFHLVQSANCLWFGCTLHQLPWDSNAFSFLNSIVCQGVYRHGHFCGQKLIHKLQMKQLLLPFEEESMQQFVLIASMPQLCFTTDLFMYSEHCRFQVATFLLCALLGFLIA